MNRAPQLVALLIAFATVPCWGEEPTETEMVKAATKRLIELQGKDGSWAYEGVYRKKGRIPVPYRVGGTAIVGEALLVATKSSDKQAQVALTGATRFILDRLDHAQMVPSVADVYDVRVWGHTYALTYFCRLLKARRARDHKQAVEDAVDTLVKTLLFEQIQDGGWNYNNHRRQCSFVTGPTVQALLLAKARGREVPDAVFLRARRALESAQLKTGPYTYIGPAKAGPRATPAGSTARATLCNTVRILLGAGSVEELQRSIDLFHEHWGELEKRRKKTGTHVKPYGIAPYYVFFAHRWIGQAIELLPRKVRAAERERLLDRLRATRDPDGTWNDRVFPLSKSYGTAMAVLGILGKKQALPKAVKLDD